MEEVLKMVQHESIVFPLVEKKMIIAVWRQTLMQKVRVLMAKAKTKAKAMAMAMVMVMAIALPMAMMMATMVTLLFHFHLEFQMRWKFQNLKQKTINWENWIRIETRLL